MKLIAENNYEIKKRWREHFNSNNIVLSTAARITFDTVMHNQFVVVSGISGSGKSTVTQNAALRLSASLGYLVVSHMSFGQNFPHGYGESETGLKIIYVMDGFLWERSFSDNDHVGMNTMFTKMKDIAERNLNSRFLMTCKSGEVGVNKIKDILPSIVECNLHSPELKLSLSERRKMCCLYFPDETNVCQNDEILLTTEQLPLLCTLYTKHFCTSFLDFVLNPDAIITSKIVEMKELENPSYICLALLLIYGGENILVHFNESFDIEDVYTVVHTVVAESGFQNKSMSRNLILSGFEAMEGIYVKTEEQSVSFIHDKIYEVVVNCIGINFKNSLLRFAKYSFIEHFESRLRLDYFESREHTQSDCIVLNQTLDEKLFARLLMEIKNYNERVFENLQNKDQYYRKSFIRYLEQHLNKSDLKYLKQPFVLSCKFGFDDFVSFFVGLWKKQLKSLQFDSETPLFAASSKGHLHTVKILVESSIGIDKSNEPFQVACQKGYTNIVTLFLNHGINPDIMKCFKYACDNGHAEVSKLLLKKQPKLLISCYGNIRLQRACRNGFEEIVGILLRHNVLVNNTNTSLITPLYLASMNGYWNIVKMLLNASAKVNERDIIIANWSGKEDIAKYIQRYLNFQNGNAINPD